jgi:hypothetical protein
MLSDRHGQLLRGVHRLAETNVAAAWPILRDRHRLTLVVLARGNKLINAVMLNHRAVRQARDRHVILRVPILTASIDDASVRCFLIHPPPSHTLLSSSSIGVATMTGDQFRKELVQRNPQMEALVTSTFLQTTGNGLPHFKEMNFYETT